MVERGSERGGVAAERSRSGRCYTGKGALGPESGWLWSAVVMTIVGHSPPLRVRVDWIGVERGGEGKGGGQTVDRKGGEPGQEQRRFRTRYKTHATRLGTAVGGGA